MPYTALTNTQGSMYLNKLRGYFGMSMDMRFRMVINANRFQQGRYCMGFVPLCSPAPTTSQLKNLLFNNMHMATLVQRTTVPHVEIDLATGTSAELLVPFMSPNNFYPLNNALAGTDTYPLGYLNVYPYAPLVSPAGSTVASYTVYVCFENIRLFGAASPQSGISDKEVANKSNGIVSAPLRSLSRGFNEFANIPLLSSYAKSVSWVLERTANVASVFGFSKPLQGDSITKMMSLNAPGHSHIDGDSDARTLSIISKPGVVTMDGIFGTTYDEMDFSYIVRKYAWFNTASWLTSSPVGNLYNIDVKPSVGSYSVASSLNLTPLAFVSDFFLHWRGSIKFKFKIVKTEFHSGRLSFSFYPTDDTASYVGNPYYVNRVIVDVRDTTEVELIIPYINRNPWELISDRIGVLAIDVVDPLVAPATVSSTVTILNEISGGDDFELSVPNSFDYTVTSITPQSGLVDTSILKATIGSSSVQANSLAATATSVGEKVTNFRAYLKRFSPISPAGVASGTYALNGVNTAFPPDFIMATAVASTPPATYWKSDMYGLIASCYGMVRGGVRFRDVLNVGLCDLATSSTSVIPRLQSNTNVYYNTGVVGQISNPIVQSNTNNPAYAMNFSNIIQTTQLNNTITFEVPQYTTGYARSTVDMISYQSTSAYGYNGVSQSTTTRGTVNIVAPAGLIANYDSSHNAGFTIHNLYRSASEDTSFGTFISVPPLFATASNKVTGFY